MLYRLSYWLVAFEARYTVGLAGVNRGVTWVGWVDRG